MPALILTTLLGQQIEAEVVCDGYRKGISAEGPWREVVYKVAWGDSDNFMDTLMGVAVASSTGSVVSFPQPHAYPGNPRLLCTEVSGVPVGRDGQPDPKLFASDWCFVTARYGTPPFDVTGQYPELAFGQQAYPWTQMRSRGYTMSEQVPNSALQSQGADGGSSGKPLTKNTSVEVPVQDVIVTRYFVPYLPDDLLMGLTGKLNAGVFLGRDRGTVKFQSFDFDPQNQGDGSMVGNVVLNYVWRPYDWNYQMVDKDGVLSWDQFADSDGNTPYGYADLSSSLTFGL